ncbi:MAG: C69 family dipeptidase, partial [Paludibacteraceae bacterium]
MLKKTFFTVMILMSLTAIHTFACTNFLVGKNATTDGSTFISYAADSYFLFGALYHYPAATYSKGAKLEIHDWDTGKYLGEIDQAKETYNVIGNMNEFQVSIGE